MSSTLLKSTFAAAINSGEQVTQNDAGAEFDVYDNPAIAPIVNGTGAGAAQHLWKNTFTVNTSGTTLDLTSLAGGLDGGTRDFTKVKSIKVTNNDGTNVVNVGNAASNPWTGLCSSGTATLPVHPGGHLWNHAPDAAGLAVGGSNKNLLIAAAAATASVTVTIIGEGT
jgi:hypothetical protein